MQRQQHRGVELLERPPPPEGEIEGSDADDGLLARIATDRHNQRLAVQVSEQDLIEPAAILEPDFALNRAWAAQTRERHEAFLTRRWTKASSVAFLEMNADFHEGLARASTKRFFCEVLHRLNRLRRLSNHDWRHGRDRVTVSVWST